jgi:hypothetical protein
VTRQNIAGDAQRDSSSVPTIRAPLRQRIGIPGK